MHLLLLYPPVLHITAEDIVENSIYDQKQKQGDHRIAVIQHDPFVYQLHSYDPHGRKQEENHPPDTY